MGILKDEGAQQLFNNAVLRSRLKSLDVSECFLSKAMVTKLATAFKSVIAKEQREAEDEDDYYVAVGE